MIRPIQLTQATSSRRTSEVTRQEKRHSLIAGLQPPASILARRITFPLLLLTAGLFLVQPCAGQSGSWITSGSLLTARYAHTATLLPDGKVLAAGGFKHYYLSSAELYDPATGTWMHAGSVATGRLNTCRPSANHLRSKYWNRPC